jgi:hypothetical protein
MSTVERAVVGRKTPGDGKLEISAALARALGGHGAPILVHLANDELGGSVQIMECTCAKAGAAGKHEHHFVQCDAFREMAVGTEVQLSANAARLDVALG